jgi:hypothetical protein
MTRSLSSLVAQSRDMSVRSCLKLASAAGYQYAGLQAGTYCMAGNSIQDYTTPGTCSTPCAGNADEVSWPRCRGHQG